MPHVLYHGTHIVRDNHGLSLVLALDTAPSLYPYNTYHDDRHEDNLSNGAMNEHCAVYYVLNEAMRGREKKKKLMKINWYCF